MARVWLIAGPTASGKSALALHLAHAVGGEIVNADSMQLYRDLRVLTARPSPADEAAAKHHLFGVADGAQAWSVGRWRRAAAVILAEIAVRNRPAIVVGGTGLYFRALTHGLADVPDIPEAVRTEARASYEHIGEAAFRDSLRTLDPWAEAQISLGDRQRLTRAMEVVRATGRPLADWQAQATATLRGGDVRALVLDPPRADLYARCDARLLAMTRAGALDEVRALVSRRLDPTLPVQKALGVRELARHVAGELSLTDAVRLAQQETRRYAKRQATWFRHQTPDWPRITSLDRQVQRQALSSIHDLDAPASA